MATDKTPEVTDLTTKQKAEDDVTTAVSDNNNVNVGLNVLNAGQNITTVSSTTRIFTTQKQTTDEITTKHSTRVGTSSEPTIKSTTSSTTVGLTKSKIQVVVSGKTQPPYKILTLEPESTTPGGGINADGAKKATIIGISVGLILGIILIAAIVFLIFFLKKRRRTQNLRKDLVQVENPRYKPSNEKTGGFFRGDKGANNNKDGDIEILATRSSSRRKRRAPPPPNPFGDDEFTGDRRASQDPDLSPPPVELSTFAHLSGPDKQKSPEEKPLLKKNGKAAQDANPGESDENSDLDDKDTSKLVHDEGSAENSLKMPKTPDDYDKTKNPFGES